MAPRPPSTASLDLVVDKLAEARFMLALLDQVPQQLDEVRYLFNATANASYACLESLKAATRRHPPMKAAADLGRAELTADPVCEYVLQRRNEAVHIGESRVRAQRLVFDEQQRPMLRVVFKAAAHTAEAVTLDVRDAAQRLVEAVGELVEGVVDAYPDFTRAGAVDAARRPGGPSTEDIETRLGFPRGWSAMHDMPDDLRLAVLETADPPPPPSPIHQAMHERFSADFTETEMEQFRSARVFED